jgi:hypothetical protein
LGAIQTGCLLFSCWIGKIGNSPANLSSILEDSGVYQWIFEFFFEFRLSIQMNDECRGGKIFVLSNAWIFDK